MMTTDKLLDAAQTEAKLEAVEARTQTKFAQLLGKMDLLGEKISGVSNDISDLKLAIGRVDSKTSNTRIIVVTTIIGAFLATAGIVYTVAAYSVAIADFIKGN